MFNRRLAFVAVFLILYLVLEAIVRFSLWLAIPGGPPIDIHREWVQLLLLPCMIAFLCVLFPVDEERFPIRSVLISIAVYWVYLAVMVIVKSPESFGPVLEALIKYTVVMGAIAGLAAFCARKIQLAYEAQRDGATASRRR